MGEEEKEEGGGGAQTSGKTKKIKKWLCPSC